MRKLAGFLAIAAAVGIFCAAWMYSVAVRDPVVRTTSLAMPEWPAGAPAVRVALLSDIHVAGPDMPPGRLARVVRQVNALRPDIVLFAGDFVSDKRPATRHFGAAEAIAPLSRLKPRLGAFAVLGNHDHWRNRVEIAGALQEARVKLLDNDAVSVGPLRLGGVDDAFTGRADVAATVARMRSGAGARLMLSHSPDVAPRLPADITLLLAGHTHCGQIRLPVIGAFAYMSDYGDRYACGLVREGPRRAIVSAGIGTSVIPLRLGAVPDLWLIRLGPSNR